MDWGAEPVASLVLASGSPRRRDLLAAAGVSFEVQPADIDETALPDEAPGRSAVRLALEKARRVAHGLAPAARLVLGADTVVALGDTTFGKPRSSDDAVRILHRLAGHTHEVITAVAIVRSDTGEAWEQAVRSRVTLRSASHAEIERYVSTGEPLDKAGAYALQGAGRQLVERVEGSESNVIGLPVEETLALIARARGGTPA